MEDIIKIETIGDFNNIYGLTEKHPMVAIVHFTPASKLINHVKLYYGLYALFLKLGVGCTLKYGRQTYDYQEGTVVGFAPGQILGVEMKDGEAQPEAYGLLFHPDFIHGSALGKRISQYTFFDYDQVEALHLSKDERSLFLDCLKKTKSEIDGPGDQHTKELITGNIELLLNYCLRFYDRQFDTRKKANSNILMQFNSQLNEYMHSGQAKRDGLASVKYFADKVCLTPNYFGDLIKKETGKTAQEYIRLKVIDASKEFLLGTNMDISQIAYALGFQYPQHFTRLFKKETGCTPTAYREQA